MIDLGLGRSLLDPVAITQDFEDILGHEEDVVTEAGVSPYLREQVLREAVPL
jgi:predicted nucleotidyltransferase